MYVGLSFYAKFHFYYNFELKRKASFKLVNKKLMKLSRIDIFTFEIFTCIFIKTNLYKGLDDYMKYLKECSKIELGTVLRLNCSHLNLSLTSNTSSFKYEP